MVCGGGAGNGPAWLLRIPNGAEGAARKGGRSRGSFRASQMNIEHVKDAKVETVTISQRPTALMIIFVVLPVLIMLQVSSIALSRGLPLPLMVLLIAVMASSIALAGASLELIMPVTLILNRQGLIVRRLLGAKLYGWSDIGDMRLVAANGQLSDDPQADGLKQVGIGLFLRSNQRSGNAKPAADARRDADSIIVSCASSHALKLQELIETLIAFQRKALDGGVAQPKRISGALKPTGEFRRKPRGAEGGDASLQRV
jgi:hypothetical protein